MHYGEKICAGCAGAEGTTPAEAARHGCQHHSPAEGSGGSENLLSAVRNVPGAQSQEARIKALLLAAKVPAAAEEHDWANDAEWQELRALIVEALEQHPAAFAAVLDALDRAGG